jgi:hypothetical protein
VEKGSLYEHSGVGRYAIKVVNPGDEDIPLVYGDENGMLTITYGEEKILYDVETDARFLEVPEGVTTIGMAAFDECTALESIELPASLTNIDAYAFDGCKKITAVIYAGTVSKWGNIAKNSNWNRGTGEYTVYCADGRITKDGAITYV